MNLFKIDNTQYTKPAHIYMGVMAGCQGQQDILGKLKHNNQFIPNILLSQFSLAKFICIALLTSAHWLK